MSAPQIVVTAEDRGPLVNIVAWVALIAVCLATFVKVAVKLWRIRRLERDDVYMLGAMVSFISVSITMARECNPSRAIMWLNLSGIQTAAVLQTIAVVEQVKYGLGRHIVDLSTSQVQATELVRN